MQLRGAQKAPIPGGFLIWEAHRDYTRETITVAAGTHQAGTVLGNIKASGKYAAHDPAATDGTETAVAVLWSKTDASAGDVAAVALIRGPAVVNRHDLVFAGTPSEGEIAAAHTALLAEATFEFHLFNGIQGVVKDPRDGVTVIDYHAEFGITPAAEVDFDLDNATPASGALRKRCQASSRASRTASAGWPPGRSSCARNAARPSLPISSPTRRSARPISTPLRRPICAAAWARK